MLLKLVVYDEEYFIVFLIYNNNLGWISIYILYAQMKSPELAESTTHI